MCGLFAKRGARIATVCSVVLAESAALAAETMPVRQPGYWHIRTISESFGTREGDVCITASDPLLPDQPQAVCKPLRVERGGQEVIVTQECEEGGERRVTSILFTGDFQTWYRGQSRLSTRPANQQGIPVTVGFTIDANRIGGTCPSK